MTPQYAVLLSRIAQTEFDELAHADRKLARQIARAIDRLAMHPELGEFLKGDRAGYRKYRTGDYRIIYRVEHARLLIYVMTLDNRKDVYR